MYVLHQMQESGNCYKVRLTARQLEIPIKLREYGMKDGSTRTPGFLAMNPNGRVPLLELGEGRFLAESGAIIHFLAEGSHLIPNTKWDRAQMLQWMFFEQYSHEPYVAVARYWLKLAPPEDLEARKHLVPEWHEKGNAALGVMETHLAAHDWFAGNRCSLADIALYGYTHVAVDGGFELSRYPALSRWLGRVAEQPNHITIDET
ncbi:MAG TPA: glutathione S-transferase family protein [Rhizomicrobium sp.]|nr:glutathione S-transferase family protein [Rhizomicrobium sp.]